MKKFLAVYIGSASAREKSEMATTTSEERRRELAQEIVEFLPMPGSGE